MLDRMAVDCLQGGLFKDLDVGVIAQIEVESEFFPITDKSKLLLHPQGGTIKVFALLQVGGSQTDVGDLFNQWHGARIPHPHRLDQASAMLTRWPESPTITPMKRLLVFILPIVLAISVLADPSQIQWIDVHNHIYPDQGSREFTKAVQAALAQMDQVGISKMVLMPPPGGFCPDITFLKACPKACGTNRGRFVFGAGNDLNAMIENKVSDTTKRTFEQKANELVDQGASVFGEILASAMNPAHGVGF